MFEPPNSHLLRRRLLRVPFTPIHQVFGGFWMSRDATQNWFEMFDDKLDVNSMHDSKSLLIDLILLLTGTFETFILEGLNAPR